MRTPWNRDVTSPSAWIVIVILAIACFPEFVRAQAKAALTTPTVHVYEGPN
jgi:hypothetical protein